MLQNNRILLGLLGSCVFITINLITRLFAENAMSISLSLIAGAITGFLVFAYVIPAIFDKGDSTD